MANNVTKWKKHIALQLLSEIHDWLIADENNLYWDEFLYGGGLDMTPYPAKKFYPELLPYLCRKYPDFRAEHDLLKKITEVKVKSAATHNKINTQMAKFVLSAKYGYTEKSEAKVEVKNTPILTVDPLNDDDDNKKQ